MKCKYIKNKHNNKKFLILNKLKMSDIIHIDYIFKITVLGDVYTGKTTLIDQLKYPASRSGKEEYLSTIGVEYQTVLMMQNEDQKIIKLGVWDTSGDKIFESILETYYHNISALVAVFSGDNYTSFKNAIEKVKYFREKFGKIPQILLIKNKNDLKNIISEDEINEVMQKYSCLYFSCNSLTGENVYQAFNSLKNAIYQTYISSGLEEDFPGITIMKKNYSIIKPRTYYCWDFLW